MLDVLPVNFMASWAGGLVVVWLGGRSQLAETAADHAESAQGNLAGRMAPNCCLCCCRNRSAWVCVALHVVEAFCIGVLSLQASSTRAAGNLGVTQLYGFFVVFHP